MGLIKYFEQREKKQGFKRAFNREEQNGSNPLGGYFEKRHMNERIEHARLSAYESEKIRQARIKGKRQAQSGGTLGGMKTFAKGAANLASDIGSFYNPKATGMFSLPGQGGQGLFDIGPPSRAKQAKKKGKGKTITIHVK